MTDTADGSATPPAEATERREAPDGSAGGRRSPADWTGVAVLGAVVAVLFVWAGRAAWDGYHERNLRTITPGECVEAWNVAPPSEGPITGIVAVATQPSDDLVPNATASCWISWETTNGYRSAWRPHPDGNPTWGDTWDVLDEQPEPFDPGEQPVADAQPDRTLTLHSP